jgi:hypothetical protein
LGIATAFLDDALSIITGPYDDLLSIDDVIEQELILFVTLNVNKNTEPVRALGKMLLQNIQLVVGKRYESEEERKRANRPLFSVVMDEFASFGYAQRLLSSELVGEIDFADLFAQLDEPSE